MSTDIQLARETLGARLRALRRSTGLSGKDFAADLGWPQSKVSKLETGRQTPSQADIAAWTQAAGHAHVGAELTAQLAELELFYSEYRKRLRASMRHRQVEALAAETKMKYLRTFGTGRIPAFFQTPEYARCILSLGARLYGAPDDVAEAVSVRMRRQEVLYRPGKRFHIVVTESVLRSCAVAPAEVMVPQLDRLVAATALGATVKFGVIPFGAQWPIALDHGFWLYDDSCVIVETLSAELRLTRPDEIQLYSRAFDQLAATASYGPSARAIITRALTDLSEHANENRAR